MNTSTMNKSMNTKSKLSVFSITMIGLAIILILFFIYSNYKGYTNFQTYSPSGDWDSSGMGGKFCLRVWDPLAD